MKKNTKRIVMMASIILTLAISVAGTLAWLYTEPQVVENTFIPTEVPNKVVETFDGTTKTNVKIKNVGNIDAYVRASVIATWAEVDSNGNPTHSVYNEKPALAMSDLGTDWVYGNDGYYYYTKKVASGDETGVMFSSIALADNAVKPTAAEGYDYVLSVEIMGQTIQAEPDSVVGSVWTNDFVTVAGNNGILTVTNK